MGFTNWQERAEKAEEVLRSLASFVGAGGYNADKVDADVFEQKIRWGIGQIMERLEKAEMELARLREQKPVAWINLNKWTRSNGPRCVTREEYEKERELLTKLTAVYAAPVPAVAAPVVPEDYRQALVEIALRCTDHDATDAIDALLQSATQSGSDPVAHHPV